MLIQKILVVIKWKEDEMSEDEIWVCRSFDKTLWSVDLLISPLVCRSFDKSFCRVSV